MDAVTSFNSSLITALGISYKLTSTILSELADSNCLINPTTLLAFPCLEPSMHQSGRDISGNAFMVKRGSTYLKWAMLNEARLVFMKDPTFSDYYYSKHSEGKHHNVALSTRQEHLFA